MASLRALVDAGHDVALVVTGPDRRRGRGAGTSPTPVAQLAHELNLRTEHDLSNVLNVDAEIAVVVAYGALIPAAVLEHLAMLNVHFSLLPRWRGAAPVQRAILAGDVETGVCVMRLEESLDTGPVYARRATSVGQKSADELTNELAIVGAQLLIETLATSPLRSPAAQVGESTYARKLTSRDFALDPSLGAEQLSRTVRCGPGVARIGPRRLLVVSAQFDEREIAAGDVAVDERGVLLGTERGSLLLGNVRGEGSRTMTSLQWWHGAGLANDSVKWSRDVAAHP